MTLDPSVERARAIMLEFADQTGISTGSGVPPRRYLWTDAFAVCNFLGLYRKTQEERLKQLALRLVDQVHVVLGRRRKDDPRSGWISGLGEEEGKAHPTKGGLRIGKELNERKVDDPLDERLEWDRDGQYYHYLTKWMHALNVAARMTSDPTYLQWAMELAKTAHSRFVYLPYPGGRKRMYWKMSIDLSRPLVSSMGHHDPLDGFLTYCELQAAASEHPEKKDRSDLSREIADMAAICEGKDWVTDDPLGIGGLLTDAHKVGQLKADGSFEQTKVLVVLLDAALAGLESYAGRHSGRLPAEYRLAFRELGLSIGLKAVERLQRLVEQNQALFGEPPDLQPRLQRFLPHMPLVKDIEAFWLEPENQASAGWRAHQDINMVMLASSLAPDGYLTH